MARLRGGGVILPFMTWRPEHSGVWRGDHPDVVEQAEAFMEGIEAVGRVMVNVGVSATEAAEAMLRLFEMMDLVDEPADGDGWLDNLRDLL